MISIEKIPLRTLFWSSGYVDLFSFAAKSSLSGVWAMFKQKGDEFYSASPTPEEEGTQEDTITVEVTRDDLALL